MILERTLAQLDIGPVAPQHAQTLGQLGYMQWLGGLPGHVSYPEAATRAGAGGALCGCLARGCGVLRAARGVA